MKPSRIPVPSRAVLLLLLAPTVAMDCTFVGAVDPFLDVDPATVPPPDPSEEPTGEFRSIDGTGNHETYFYLGAADTPLRRMAPSEDGDDSPQTGKSGACD